MVEMIQRFARNVLTKRSQLRVIPLVCCALSAGVVSNAYATQVDLEVSSTELLVEDTTAHALFSASGLQALVQQIPTSTASSFEAALTADQLPVLFAQVDQESIRQAVSHAFKLETFDKYMIKELDTGMSLLQREQMLDWYASDLGSRGKQAELDNSLLTQQARFIDFQNLIAAYPVSAKREQLILNLDYTMKSTESAVDMMTSIQMAFNLSLSRFMPEEMRLSRQEMLALAEQDTDQLLEQYEQQTQDVLLFTYQDLNDDELGQLDDALATDAGQKFVLAINNGIKKAMFAASLDLGDGLGALLNENPRGPGI